MIQALKTWLMGMVMMSLALSLAENMVSQEGVRKVLRLVGGVLMLAVMMRPFLLCERLELPDFSGYVENTRELSRTLSDSGSEYLAGGIEEELEAYIWDKAQELGLDGDIELTVKGENGVPLPAEIRLDMPFHQQLSEIIQKELGLDRENQVWQED